MSPLPVIPDVYRCALKWANASGGYAINVTHWHYLGGLTDPLAIAADLAAKWIANDTAAMYGAQTISMSGDLFTITPLDGSTASVDVAASGVIGTSGGQTIPNMAAVIKLKTGLRGREYRGRVYLPGVSESLSDNGLLSGNALPANLGPAWAQFLTDMAVDDWQWVVASYKLAVATPVTSVTSEKYAGTQRRRLSRIR